MKNRAYPLHNVQTPEDALRPRTQAEIYADIMAFWDSMPPAVDPGYDPYNSAKRPRYPQPIRRR